LIGVVALFVFLDKAIAATRQSALVGAAIIIALITVVTSLTGANDLVAAS
jgi:hypothetical protein